MKLRVNIRMYVFRVLLLLLYDMSSSPRLRVMCDVRKEEEVGQSDKRRANDKSLYPDPSTCLLYIHTQKTAVVQ